MIHLAIITDPEMPASIRFYRTQGVFPLLEKQTGGRVRVTEVPIHQFIAHEANALAYDVAIIERPINPRAQTAIQMCKGAGTMCWGDYDDDLFNIPDYNNSQDYYAVEQNTQLVQQCMAAFDIITVSTPALRDLYSGINPNIIVVPNAWNDFRYPFSDIRDPSGPIRMAWRGTNKHYGDVDSVRAPMARSLQDPAFAWAFFGWRPPLLQIKRNQYRPFSGLFSYFKTFAASAPDYLVVPLEVNAFNKSKSNCSWLEATGFAGAVTIAPMGLPEFDRPGVIRYKDAKHLEDIFKGIKAGKYDKRERVEAGREDIRENYRLSQINAIRGAVIEKAFGVAATALENAGESIGSLPG